MDKSKDPNYLARKRKHQRKQLIVFGSLTLILLLLIGLLIRGFIKTESKPIESEAPTTVPTEPVQTEKIVNLIAVGDNLMHEAIVDSVRTEDGYDFSPIFAKMKSDFTNADIACLMQETILVEDDDETNNSLPYYGTSKALAPAVQAAGFDVVAQATEHSYDMGLRAIQFTKSTWKDLGVACLGIHAEENEAISIVERNGVRIAFLNYTYLDDEVLQADEDFAVDYLQDKDKVAGQIEAAKNQSDMVIVLVHWGEMTTYEANEEQQSWAQLFADAGVGAVIGSHPHVLQPTAQILGKNGNIMPVFYSLGNYMTDMGSNYNMLGGMAQISIVKNESGTFVTSYRLVPLVEVIDESEYPVQRFYTVKMADYTEEMEDAQQLPDTDAETLMDLYESIVSADIPDEE